MNRIRTLREAKGLTGEQLAERIGTTAATVSRLETGRRQLTLEWMMRVAEALDCQPLDLLGAPTVSGLAEEAEPYTVEDTISRDGLAAKHLFFYTVRSDALSKLGINAEDVLLFDFSVDTLEKVATGDVVLATATDSTMGDTRSLVRQFVAPDLLVTNRDGVNQALSMDSVEFELLVRAVRVPYGQNGKNHG